MRRVALLFEFNTINGGENSILTALDHLAPDSFEFIALAPDGGRLSEALRKRAINHIPIRLRDESGSRLSRAEVCDHLLEK